MLFFFECSLIFSSGQQKLNSIVMAGRFIIYLMGPYRNYRDKTTALGGKKKSQLVIQYQLNNLSRYEQLHSLRDLLDSLAWHDDPMCHVPLSSSFTVISLMRAPSGLISSRAAQQQTLSSQSGSSISHSVCQKDTRTNTHT